MNASLIGVNGVNGVIQHLADLVVIVYSEPNESENAQFGRKEFVALYS